MIAGLPQAPSSQNPIANPTAAKKRRNHVLERLLEIEYITEEAYQAAIREPITASYHGVETDAEAPYVAEMIRSIALRSFWSRCIHTRLQSLHNHSCKLTGRSQRLG